LIKITGWTYPKYWLTERSTFCIWQQHIWARDFPYRTQAHVCQVRQEILNHEFPQHVKRWALGYGISATGKLLHLQMYKI
jgi:hypothetical protein